MRSTPWRTGPWICRRWLPLRRVIRAVDPDLVHTHGSMSARMAARLCGKKVIYTKHCVFPLGRVMGSPVGRLAGHVLDACLSDGAIAVSPSVRELLLQSGVPDRKIHVLFNGVAPLAAPTEEERTALRAEYGFGPEDFVVGILARVEEYKGHSVLLDAAEQLLSQGRRVKVLVAGEGRAEAAPAAAGGVLPQGTVFLPALLSGWSGPCGPWTLRSTPPPRARGPASPCWRA